MNKTIIGVKFKRAGKIYFFDPGKEVFNKGDFVIVETTTGTEYAEVVTANKEISEEKLNKPLMSIMKKI